MKNFKRIQAMFLAVIMAVMTIGSTTAFAAESASNGSTWVTTDEFEIVGNTVSNVSENSNMITLVNQSFPMSGVHTGSTRTYNYYTLGFICNFTDQNGNIPSDGTILAVRLYNASTNTFVKEWQGSNGCVLGRTIPITYGNRYYFQYLVAYGTNNLKVDMLIFTVP